MSETRILITGASGFVGQHLVSYLQNHNPEWELYFLIRDEVQNPTLVNESKVIRLKDLEVSMDRITFKAIIHLAGKAHDTSKTADPESYFTANYELTKSLYDAFSKSQVSTFIFLSTIKSVHHNSRFIANELQKEQPLTPYGKSKKKAEEYIISNQIPENKRYFILRPVLIYGKGVKGNLRSLAKFVSKGIPYPFAAFENKRSYLSVINLCFVIDELIKSKLTSDTFNLADNEPLSTIQIIKEIGSQVNKRPILIKIPKFIWYFLAWLGDKVGGPFNSEILSKLTESMVVNNSKIISSLKMALPQESSSSIGNIV